MNASLDWTNEREIVANCGMLMKIASILGEIHSEMRVINPADVNEEKLEAWREDLAVIVMGIYGVMPKDIQEFVDRILGEKKKEGKTS